ncbi:DNA-3-methyladenine glycosylase [Enterococcus timonensis]|uniref:DNA-3-methyladenine glycosylase n=1 Tax=Enterococcus timonensis TaxID=1852364 RepID=UPI0008D9F059|nr:DNA-3-methyladenine glycosylase [Enterococcus timonensis]
MLVKDIFQLENTALIAEKLLGHLLTFETPAGIVSGYIVDCEAYVGPLDAASHSFGGRQTPRLRAMYQSAGTIYAYIMHTHLLLNLVTQKSGSPQGVMIRAIEPAAGLEIMEKNRNKVGVNLTNGPGKLTQAMGLTKDIYGTNIFSGPLKVSDIKKTPVKIITAPRIGIPNKGVWTLAPLRFYVAGNPYVSQIKKSEVDEFHGWSHYVN